MGVAKRSKATKNISQD